MLITCSSDDGDVIWEPFGGTCSASLSAKNLGRKYFASEVDYETYLLAKSVLKN
jgi:site-specific DNA-methyltransferase (adenine-specific)